MPMNANVPVSDASSRSLLLLSGGHDSIALAVLCRPSACLTIDYGQRPVVGEMRAAKAVVQALALDWHQFQVDLSPIGSGLLHDDGAGAHADADAATAFKGGAPVEGAPSPEWWPYRNQLLVSLAAAWALPRGFDELVIGSVAPDGERHKDGTPGFYQRLNELVSYQEGGIRVTAPAIGLSSAELIRASGVTDAVLGFAHSCHVAAYPCGMCPGCRKHEDVIQASGRFR